MTHRAPSRVPWLAAIVATIVATVAATGARAEPAPADDQVVVQVPLDDGEVVVSTALIALCDAVGIEPPAALLDIDWRIPVSGPLGPASVRTFNRLADGVATLEAEPDRVVLRLDRATLEAAGVEAEEALADWLERTARRLPGPRRLPFGVSMASGPHAGQPVGRLEALPSRLVILIHGLDDPGWTWRDLVPALDAAGLAVVRFEYPNDGPIAESADLFAAALADLRERGVDRVDVIAHSMGGLVTRDVLTRPAYYAGDGSGEGRFPAVDRLVMVGTPNHGSQMARLRQVSELHETLSRLFSSDGPDPATDGDGEAAEDLLPESVFLKRLNRRGQVAHTTFTIIAGRISPVSEEKVEAIVSRATRFARSDSAPEWLRDWAATAESEIASTVAGAAVRGLGDGVVTIDSTRLAGVEDHKIVQANHLSILVNTLESPDRVPPAIPIILDRLEQE